MTTILLTNYYNENPLRIVQSEVPYGFELLTLDRPGREAVLAKIAEADYLLAGGRVQIDRELLQSASRLKMVQRTGVGLDTIDQNALKERSIPLFVNAGINASCVAEHTLTLILGVLRRINEVDAKMKAGKWLKHDIGVRCNELRGKTIGLIGFGDIGQRVAILLKAFGVNMIYCKRTRLPYDEEQELSATYVEFNELLHCSDIVSLHCPLNNETKDLIGEKQIAMMKEGAIVINTARGALIDENALLTGLTSGHIRGAGLDVFASEPLSPNNPLRSLNNVLLSPHMAGLTTESFRRMMREAMQSIERYEQQRTKIES